MLDSFGVWGKVILNRKNFTFEEHYTLPKTNIQLWRGTNGEPFVLKNVEEDIIW